MKNIRKLPFNEKLKMMDKILAKSTLTEKDAIDIGKEIKKGIAKKHGIVK